MCACLARRVSLVAGTGEDRAFLIGRGSAGHGITQLYLTSFAETICSGRRAILRSAVLVSRSYRAWAMLCSSSEGDCLDELLGSDLVQGPGRSFLLCGGEGVDWDEVQPTSRRDEILEVGNGVFVPSQP